MARHRGAPGGRPATGRPAAAQADARGARHARPPDQVYRSSFFLLASTVVTAALGFLFWVVVARFYTPEQVGMATSLISATSLLAYLSLFGLNSTLIRFPAPAFARNAQVTQSIALVGAVACAAGTVYLLGLPLYGEKLLFVRDHPVAAVGFVLCCACAAVNLLTDSVFISARMPQYNVIVDGLLQGLVKLALPVGLVAFGSVGIVGATGGGYLVAVLASLFLMRRRLGFRFDFRTRGTRLREQLRFSVASYVSSLLNLVPLMATPLIVLHELGAASAGYYFVAFQIAGLLNAVSTAVGEALFAEVSFDESRFAELLRRSARIIAAVQLPAVVVVALGSGLLLRMFGGGYATRAHGLLVVLACGALAVALNTWASFALKLARRMKHLILSNVVYAVVTIGLAALWAPRGLVWLGWAWGAGNLASGLYAAVALIGRRTAAAPPPTFRPPPVPPAGSVPLAGPVPQAWPATHTPPGPRTAPPAQAPPGPPWGTPPPGAAPYPVHREPGPIRAEGPH
ncbi:lipopolysaccharide biosynthesis protein [Kitasatospora sp. NPDC088346]|uniref:lipopolysaccharide biosynthesis protein n=1 Tax=Kitasatospora sp. NPDC088346 TaxID=3364073 RepID=UPI003803AD21